MDNQQNNSLNGVTIYLLGSPSLKKHLTSFYLRQETGAYCVLYDDYEGLQRTEHGQSIANKSVVLWDVFSLKRDVIISDLSQQDILSRFSLALFDLGPECEVEGMAIQLGVKGFFYRGDKPQQLVKGLKHICNGHVWVSPKIIQDYLFGSPKAKRVRAAASHALTQREEDVLRLMTHGYRNAEIAEKLTLSPNTVKAHLYQAFKKIKVNSRMMAAKWVASNLGVAQENG